MTQYNSLNVKLSNSQLNKFKLAIQNETEIVLRLSSNMIGDNETNSPHQLLLTNRQVANKPSLKNVIEPLAKSVLIPLGLTAAASAPDVGIHKKILGSGNRPSSFASHMTTLIISNDEIGDIIKIVKSLEDSDLLLKGVTKTLQNEVKEKKGGFLSMLLGILGASLLGNLFTGKRATAKSQGGGIYTAGKGEGRNRPGEGIVRAGYGNNMDF